VYRNASAPTGLSFQPSLRDGPVVLSSPPNPAINRWAIVKRPSGADYLRLVCNNEGFSRRLKARLIEHPCNDYRNDSHAKALRRKGFFLDSFAP
jgi:hypothetical protein